MNTENNDSTPQENNQEKTPKAFEFPGTLNQQFNPEDIKMCKIVIAIAGETPILIEYPLHVQQVPLVRQMLATRLISELAWSTNQNTEDIDATLLEVEHASGMHERRWRMGLIGDDGQEQPDEE